MLLVLLVNILLLPINLILFPIRLILKLLVAPKMKLWTARVGTKRAPEKKD